MLLSYNPFIAYILDNIVPNSIIEDMKAIPIAGFERSLGLSPDGTGNLTEIRTSSSYFDNGKFKSATEIILNCLSEKYNHVYDIDKTERWQITEYQPGEFYKAHYDFFHSQDQLKGKTNRIATVILYLNDGFAGGETKFPKLKINVKPRKGCCLYFTYPIDNPNNNLTFHSGEPVINGIKRIATLWLR
jgi:prolyl 4-hydroxylase